MKFTSAQYAKALYDAVHETAPKDQDKVLDNFVKVLAENGDVGKHGEIEKEYLLIEMKEKGISQAGVTVAKDMEMNSSLINQLNEIVLSSITSTTEDGNKIEIKQKVEAGIVGGVIVRVDDTLIDASIRTQLNNLNSELKS